MKQKIDESCANSSPFQTERMGHELRYFLRYEEKTQVHLCSWPGGASRERGQKAAMGHTG